MRTLLLGLALLTLASLVPRSASACSDAGPPNGACNEGGPAWITCAAHADCPTGQLCGVGGTCQCYECPWGEACTGAACRCAPQEYPDAGPSCTVETDSCGVHSVSCPDMDAGPPRCTTDGAAPRACAIDSDCEGAAHAGAGRLVCTARGVCDCDDGDSGASGCSVTHAARGAAPVLLAALVALGLAGRRRR